MSDRGLMVVAREYRPLVKAAMQSGWTLKPQGRSPHPKLVAPDGSYSTPIPTSSTVPALLRAVEKRLRDHGVAL